MDYKPTGEYSKSILKRRSEVNGNIIEAYAALLFIIFPFMLHTLRFAFLLGTLFMPFLLLLIKWNVKDNFWTEALFWWLALILASLLLKVFTNAKEKAGSTFARWRKKKKNDIPEPPTDPKEELSAALPYLPTGFINEVSELAFVGEFISMGFGLLPGAVMVWILQYLLPGIITGRLAVAIAGSISISWIFFLERRYAIKLTSPVLGIPLKWLLIPMFVFLVIYGDPSK